MRLTSHFNNHDYFRDVISIRIVLVAVLDFEDDTSDSGVFSSFPKRYDTAINRSGVTRIGTK